jgi:hypothetical protein
MLACNAFLHQFPKIYEVLQHILPSQLRLQFLADLGVEIFIKLLQR